MNQTSHSSTRHLSFLDRLLSVAGRALADATTAPSATRPIPVAPLRADGKEPEMDDASRRHAAGLMRVNHVGEVCAQALYEGHALSVGDDRLASFFMAAADEEHDHLAWTGQRLRELQAFPSLLIPLWYLGSLSIGAAAGFAGPRWALGFMAETERQVEAHLQGHLERLPEADARSRAIVEQMKTDEARHGAEAIHQGGATLPGPIRALMRMTSRIMTTVAYRI